MRNRKTTSRLACTVAFAITPLAAGQTFIEDNVTEDTVWVAEGSPYIVVDQITIGNGATLTIEAGVSVRLSSRKTLVVGDVVTATAGTLVIDGTPEAPVKISGFGGWRDYWSSVLMTELAVDAVFDADGAYVSGTKLEHVIFDHGGNRFASATITLEAASPYLREITVSGSETRALYGYPREGAPLRIDGGTFVHAPDGIDLDRLEGGSVLRDLTVGEGVESFDVVIRRGATLIENCVFQGRGTPGEDGLLVRESSNSEQPTLTIRGGVFEGFYRDVSGGGVRIEGVSTVLEGCVFRGCATPQRGAGLYAEDADVTVDGCRFEGNTADIAGGAIAVDGGRLTVTESVLVGNTAADGGALYIRAIDAALAGDPNQGAFNVFEGNTATARGSAVFNAVIGPDTDATHVCWGTIDPDEIAAMIWDGEDNENLSFVLFDPPAADCDAGCASDWNTDGVVNAADVGAYLTTYFLDIVNGTTNADFDANGVTNAADVGAFLSVYFPEANDPGCNGG